MNLIRHGTVALLLFSCLAGLLVTTYNSLDASYGYPTVESVNVCGHYKTTTIAEDFSNINIYDGIQTIIDAFAADKIGNLLDLIGALAISGLGALISLLGIFTAPFEIASILECRYMLPPHILKYLLGAMVVYLAYILISAKLKAEV